MRNNLEKNRVHKKKNRSPKVKTLYQEEEFLGRKELKKLTKEPMKKLRKNEAW